jgi:hypothetical protein
MKMNFNVFSRRDKKASGAAAQPVPARKNIRGDLPVSFRNRVLMLCRDIFAGSENGDYSGEFWDEIHQKLQYLHGSPRLSNDQIHQTTAYDAIEFLLRCPDDQFLDFVEYIFQTECFFQAARSWGNGMVDDGNNIVRKVNDFFAIDNLPYHLTNFVWQECDMYMFGNKTRGMEIANRPRVMRQESAPIHEHAIAPTLELLSDSAFTEANKEFLAALEDYRKGDYRDCLVKCGSAFESVMKVVCDKRGWQYNQSDTAKKLLNIIMKETGLESFYEAPLLIIATIRNKLSTAHGAGSQKKSVPPHVAKFVINATASAIVFLTDAIQ